MDEDNFQNKTDEVTGRAKEAVGAVGDDDGLKAEGRSDQRKAEFKDKVDEMKDKAQEKIDEIF